MANPKIKFKRSAVASKRPSLLNLELGELALNTYDGKIFTVQDTGGVGIATTVTLINPWNETYGENKISYGGTVTTGDINVNDLDGQNIFITGVTTSIGGFILRNPNADNYSRNQRPPDYSDNSGTPTMDENPIAAGIYADGSASFSGIVTASSGFVGDLTGDVTGSLTGTASNSNTVGGVTSSFLLDYTNFQNTPTIPTNNNQLTNGAGYITTSGNITGNAATATYAINAGFSTNAGYAHTAGISTTSAFATNSSYAHVAGIATYATTAGIATNAQGLTGIPNISVNNLTVQQADINGITTFHNKVHLLDNDVLHVGGAEGDTGDLQIYHDTNNSYIKDAGTGSLRILGGNTTFKNAADNKTSAAFNVASSVDLYHDGTLKLQTVAVGATVDGTMYATAFSGDGSGLTNVGMDTSNVSANTLVVAGVATFLGNVTIGGTLTYEDVTDIDSVGIITANKGVNITGGGLQVVGVATFGNDIYVDQIRRRTDNSTNTKIQLNAGQMKLFAGNGTTAKISLNGSVAITTNTTITGVLTATSFSGDGSTLSNIPTSIIAGDNISVSGSTGAVTITGLASTANVSASTVQAGIITATEQFYPPSLTTVERDGLSFNAGAFIFNETENKLQMYLGGQWKNLAFELDSYSVVGL